MTQQQGTANGDAHQRIGSAAFISCSNAVDHTVVLGSRHLGRPKTWAAERMDRRIMGHKFSY